MRRGRFKASADAPVGYYHCISRVVDRAYRFGELEKETFCGLLRLYETFCEVRVITYSVLSNHFHILVEVPRRPDVLPDDEALFAKLETFYSARRVAGLRRRWRLCLQDPVLLSRFREGFFRRMWDVSQFMKMLKQRFSRWFNREHGRVGTLWEERFRSVLIEGRGETLATVAAYIDLNCVRAGLAKDPKDYRWCGYAEAVGGNGRQAEALAGLLRPGNTDLASYRMLLYAAGAQEGNSGGGESIRRGFSPEEVERVWAEGGKVGIGEALRCRIRFFVEGAALGSRIFVEEVFRRHRSWFGARRHDGARQFHGVESPELFSLGKARLTDLEA